MGSPCISPAGRVLAGCFCLLLATGTMWAADDAASWIEKLSDEATLDQARDELRDLGKQAVPHLIRALKHDKPIIRSEAAFVLGRMGVREAVPAVTACLTDPEPLVRRKSAYALGEIADPGALDGLVEALSDKDAGVRANVCFALGQIGKPEAAPHLVKALSDESEQVRNYAAGALGFTGEKKALPALIWMAKNDPSRFVRALAVASVGNLQDPRACGILVELLKDDDLLIRLRAIEALLVITGQRRGYKARAPESARRRAAASWETWHKQNAAKLGSIEPVEPKVLFENWNGLKPKPEPAPKVKPAPAPVPTPAPQVEPKPAPVVKPSPRGDVTPEAAAFYNAGIARLAAGELDAAVDALKTCLKLAPNWKDAHFNLALACKRLGKYDEAIAQYERCLELGGDDAATLNNLGNVHERKRDLDAAEKCYRRALKAVPGNAVARYNLAELLFAKNELAEAQPLYQSLSTARLPRPLDASVVHLRLAVCLLEAGKEQEAVKSLETAVADTANPVVLREGGRLCFELRRFDRAKALFEKAWKVGGDAESAYTLALFLLRVPDEKMRNAGLAALYVEQALSAQPKDPRYLSALAEILYAQGERDKAIGVLEKALKLAPGSPALKRQLAKYRGQ